MSETRTSSSTLLPQFGIFTVLTALLVSLVGGRSVTTDKKPAGPAVEERADKAEAIAHGTDAPAKLPGHVRYLSQKGLLFSNPAAAVGGAAVAWTQLAPNTRVTVVSVPDPIDSQFGAGFDQTVEAVCRAAVHVGNLALEGYWYPWDLRRDKKERPARGPDGDPACDPGVLLFRKTDGTPDRVAVLLVGENPVSGLHTEALRAAIDLSLMSRTDGVARIVAPFFSGSQPSLTRAVRRRVEQHGPASFVICSGAATSLHTADEELPELGDRVKLSSTQASSKRLIDAAVYYLGGSGGAGTELPARLGVDMSRFAFLVESNSGFGERSLESLKRLTNEHAGRDPRRATRPAPENGPSAAGQALLLRFPMHISRLTGIHSQQRRERDERLGLAPKDGFRITFLDEARTGADLLASADEVRTALINQRLLNDYCAVLRRERVRFVGILATAPQDKIFLVEQLRRQCPNVRPFVTGADLHYVHREYLEVMQDAVVVSTYPLYPPAQEWSKPGGRDGLRLPFPSAAAEGVYNALLAVGAMAARATPGDDEKKARAAERAADLERELLDYRSPRWSKEGETRPPIWVTAVGGDARFVPLAYFRDDDPRNDPIVYTIKSATPAPSGGESPPPPFYVPPLLGPLRVAMTALLVAAVAGIVLIRWTPVPPTGVPAGTMVPAVRGQYCTLIGVGILFACLPFGLSFLPLAKPAARARVAEHGIDAVLFAAVTVMAAVHALLGLRFLCCQMRDLFRRPDGDAEAARLGLYPQWPRATSVAFAAASLTLIGWVVAGHVGAHPGAGFLFTERAAALASGHSVVVPVVAMALGLSVYGALGLRCIRARVVRRVPCPYPELRAGVTADSAAGRAYDAFRRVREQAAQLDAQMACLPRLALDPRRRRQFWLVALVACGLTAFPLLRIAATWEGPAWDALFAAGAVTLVGLAVVSGYRLYVLWRGVREMLRTIVTIPMVRAFDRLPPKVARVFRRYLLSGRWRTGDLAIPLHLYDQVRSHAARDASEAAFGQSLTAVVLRQWVSQPVPAAANGGGGSAAASGVAAGGEKRKKDKKGKGAYKGGGHPAGQGAGNGKPAAGHAAPAGVVAELPEMTGADVKPLSEAAVTLTEHLVRGWGDRPVADAFGDGGAQPVEAGEGEGKKEEPNWRDLAEQFVAVQVIVYLYQYFAQMRYLAAMTAVSVAALFVAATEYAFQPEQLIMFSAVGLATAAAVLIGWVLYRINSNEFISRVSRTAPDRFTPDAAFAGNFLAFVVPLVLVVAIQLSGRLRSVAEPLLQVVR